jgi:hypothetical protein
VIDPEATRAQAAVGKRPVWRDLPILIIISAGLVHLGRGAEVDGLVFVSIGVALIVAELRDRPAERAVSRPPDSLGPQWILLGALLCLGYGVVVGGWAIGSVPVILAVSVPGLLILPLAWRVGPAPRGAKPGPEKWLWAGIMVLVCLWELFSFLSQPDPQTDSYDHPTLSAIFNPAFESPTVRTIVLIAWLAIGMWLARRLTLGTAPKPAPGEDER